MSLANFSLVSSPSVALDREAHESGELLPGQLPFPKQHLGHLRHVHLGPTHLEQLIQLLLFQDTTFVLINQVKSLAISFKERILFFLIKRFYHTSNALPNSILA